MNVLFDIVEPLTTAELISRYWHFLKSLEAPARSQLGPVLVTLSSQAVIRGWPVGLMNHTLALATERELSPQCGVTYVGVEIIQSITITEAHRVLPFVTNGALSRSPHEQKPTKDLVRQQLKKECEVLRDLWSVKIFFDRDPNLLTVDELLNVTEAVKCVCKSVEALQQSQSSMLELADISGFHILNATDAKDFSLIRNAEGELELSFSFGRALPSNLYDRIYSLFTSQV